MLPLVGGDKSATATTGPRRARMGLTTHQGAHLEWHNSFGGSGSGSKTIAIRRSVTA